MGELYVWAGLVVVVLLTVSLAGETQTVHPEPQRCGAAALPVCSSQNGGCLLSVHSSLSSVTAVAAELSRCFATFPPQVIQASGSVDVARSVLVPLLTRNAIDFLHSAGTPEERHLWVALGDGWTKCR